jgi:putative peptidoglycan lipid II flippase
MTPLLATLKGFVVAVALAFLLGHLFGATGIAAGIAAGAWSSAASLLRKGASEFGFAVDAAAKRRLPRIVLAALAMGALLWLTSGLAPAGSHGVVRLLAVAIQIAAGIAVDGLLIQILGVASWREAANALKRPSPRDRSA